MDIPSVPRATRWTARFGFSIDDEFTLDDAVLTLGTPARAAGGRAARPRGGRGREPRAHARSPWRARGRTGQIELKLDGGELRADTPDSHGQMEAASSR